MQQTHPPAPMILRTVTAILCCATLAHASDTLSLRTLALEGGEMPEWHVALDKETYQPLSWPHTQPSAAITVAGGKELQLFEKKTNQKGEVNYVVAKTVAVPKSAEEILLLSHLDEKDGVQLTVISDTFKQAKHTDWLVINRSEFPITLRYGKDEEAIELGSGKAGIYSVQAKGKQGQEAVAQAKIKGEYRTIYSTFWPATEGQRSLVLVYDKGNQTKVKRISDFLSKTE